MKFNLQNQGSLENSVFWKIIDYVSHVEVICFYASSLFLKTFCRDERIVLYWICSIMNFLDASNLGMDSSIILQCQFTSRTEDDKQFFANSRSILEGSKLNKNVFRSWSILHYHQSLTCRVEYELQRKPSSAVFKCFIQPAPENNSADSRWKSSFQGNREVPSTFIDYLTS